MDAEWLRHEVAAQRHEAQRRRHAYLGNRAPLSAAGKIAILVDDGVATGHTMEAAIRDVRRQKPALLVVAVPVAPIDTATELARSVDDFIALDIPDAFFRAVGACYDDFRQVSDDEVIALMERHYQESSNNYVPEIG